MDKVNAKQIGIVKTYKGFDNDCETVISELKEIFRDIEGVVYKDYVSEYLLPDIYHIFYVADLYNNPNSNQKIYKAYLEISRKYKNKVNMTYRWCDQPIPIEIFGL